MKIQIKKISSYHDAIVNPQFDLDIDSMIALSEQKRSAYLRHINLYVPKADSFNSLMVILHELGHIASAHYILYNNNYTRIERIKQECAAWSVALRSVKKRYHQKASETIWKNISNYLHNTNLNINKTQVMKWILSNV